MKNTGFSEITNKRLSYNGKEPWFLELPLTGKCNFNCKYCNRFKADLNENLLFKWLKSVPKLKHIQVTGGEPTEYKNYKEIVNKLRKHTDVLGMSTNCSKTISDYINMPIDMYSVSIDDYDLSILKGRGYKDPEHTIKTINSMSKYKHVSAGTIIDEQNIDRIESIIEFILSLGVDDIRLSVTTHNTNLKPKFTKTYPNNPILNYRVKNFIAGRPMRGFPTEKCHIMENDLTIIGDKHYPCLVYFREGGGAIGKVGSFMLKERLKWAENHDCKKDSICSKYCMDFKCDFNLAKETIEKQTKRV